MRHGSRTFATGSLCAILAATLIGGAAGAAPSVERVERAAAPAGSLELVGHDPLLYRGMNAALAVHGDYAYVGSRTDGTHPNAGVFVVDVSDPSAPAIAGQIGPPDEGNVGETSREMRVWKDEELLIVMNLASNCSSLIHACSPTGQYAQNDFFKFFDISGDKAAAPELVATYQPSANVHEFFLWQDPKRPGRALLYISTPSGGQTQLLVTDISGARDGEFEELTTWASVIPVAGANLHSLSVSNDGERAFVAYLTGGFLMADTSDLAKGVAAPEIRALTPPDSAPRWDGPGAHSAVKLFGRPYALVTDEVYGQVPGLLPNHGCPWGWARMIDIRNPVEPKVVAEYKIAENQPEFCDSPDNPPDRNSLSSYSAHNPTLTKNLAFISWHAGGLQAISIANPRKPVQVAEFRPAPLPAVVTEDPALSSGRDKVVMWSYPIIQDGLIYVVDIRNGLYILEYKGPFESEVASVEFIEGNSNLGDALRFEKP